MFYHKIEIMGIRRKILLGCISLGILLFTAGVTSYFELARLNETTLQTVDKGVTGINYSKHLLDVMEAVDISVLEKMQDIKSIDTIEVSKVTAEMDSITKKLLFNFESSNAINEVVKHRKVYEEMLKLMPITGTSEQTKWYFNRYKVAYLNLAYSTKDFMVQSQEEVLDQTRLIQENAYRANMQGIMALAIAIIIIIMFFFMIDTYFIKPTTSITTALRNYLVHNTPFEVTFEGKDEVSNLKEYIEQIIRKIKAGKKNINS